MYKLHYLIRDLLHGKCELPWSSRYFSLEISTALKTSTQKKCNQNDTKRNTALFTTLSFWKLRFGTVCMPYFRIARDPTAAALADPYLGQSIGPVPGYGVSLSLLSIFSVKISFIFEKTHQSIFFFQTQFENPSPNFSAALKIIQDFSLNNFVRSRDKSIKSLWCKTTDCAWLHLAYNFFASYSWYTSTCDFFYTFLFLLVQKKNSHKMELLSWGIFGQRFSNWNSHWGKKKYLWKKHFILSTPKISFATVCMKGFTKIKMSNFWFVFSHFQAALYRSYQRFTPY